MPSVTSWFDEDFTSSTPPVGTDVSSIRCLSVVANHTVPHRRLAPPDAS